MHRFLPRNADGRSAKRRDYYRHGVNTNAPLGEIHVGRLLSEGFISLDRAPEHIESRNLAALFHLEGILYGSQGILNIGNIITCKNDLIRLSK
jgi:hypothetical protein